MKCLKCNNLDTKVVDSRVIEDWKTVRRRRECEYCGTRFTTFERTWITDLVVIKKDGTRELYDKDKIKKALFLAFAKRPFTIDMIESITSDLEAQWIAYGKEIPSQQIWEDILKVLKQRDLVAYIRFASVYQKFDDIEDFKKLIQEQK